MDSQVEQIDRDAAADYYLATKSHRTDEHVSRLVRQGDHAHALVAAFARHRTAALSASGGDAAELAAADMRAWRQREVQMLGAAISRRDWHALETAYNQLRDKMDAAIRALPLAKQEQS